MLRPTGLASRIAPRPPLELVELPSGAPAKLSRRAEALWIIGALALFGALAWLRVLDHTHPFYDDVSFLELANRVQEQGGPFALLQQLFAGRWLEDNRHPLYLALLSLAAARDPGFHLRAQLLTVGCAAFAVLACWWVARRHAGRRPALVLLACLCASETLVEYGTRPSCEPLLIGLWALALGAMLDGVEHRRAWLAAGAFAGLAQLCKGSGIFLPATFALALVWWKGPRAALREPAAWGLGLVFAVVGSPVFVRNFRVYGNPFHNANERLFWINRLPDFAETYAPHAFDKLPHGFGQYVAQLTPEKLGVRAGMSAAEMMVHVGDAMSFVAPRPFGPVHIALVILGFAGALAALRILWRAPPGFGRSLLLAHFCVGFLLLTFYISGGGSSRYVLPMTIPLVAVLAREAVALLDAPDCDWSRAWPVRVVAVGLVAVVASVILDPAPRALPQGFADTESWLSANVQPGEGFAVDARSHLEPNWHLPPDRRMEIVSAAWEARPVPATELVAHFRERGLRYVVLDASSHKDSAPRYFFFDQVPVDEEGAFAVGAGGLAGLPAGVHIAHVDPSRRWLVLELGAATAQVTP